MQILNPNSVDEMHLSSLLAEFSLNTKTKDIPNVVIENVKRGIIDSIACMIAGSKSDLTNILKKQLIGNSKLKNASIFGSKIKISSGDAACINGCSGHVLDFDDINWDISGHPTISVLPAALAIAQKNENTGAELIEAVCIGIEVSSKIGRLANPTHYKTGWHATSCIGIFAAVCAIARLYKASLNQTINALGIAASLSSGMQKNFGSMTKPFHVGNSNQNAILAIELAMQGMSANEDIFSGDLGWLNLYAKNTEINDSEKIEHLFKSWRLVKSGIVIKQYPSCGATHCALDALSILMNENKISSREIKKIMCYAHPIALQVLKHSEPKSALEGKFSMQFCLAIMAIYNKVNLSHFEEEFISNLNVINFMKKIELVESRDTFALNTPDAVPATIVISTLDSKEFKCHVSKPFGDPEKPFTNEQLKNKFFECSTMAYSRGKATKIWNTVLELENITNLNTIFQ